MEHLEILNTREVSKVHDKLEEQYGFSEKLDCAFLKSNKDKLYIVSRGIAKIDYSELNIDSVGLYFASEDSGGNLRLSIEGSQIIGPKASKNVHEIDDGLFKLWISGNDLETDKDWSPHLIVKNGNDFYGAGKVIDGKLKNFVPKSRRIVNLI